MCDEEAPEKRKTSPSGDGAPKWQGLNSPLSADQHIEDKHEKDGKLRAMRGYNSICKESIDLEMPKHEHSVARQN